ncbi:hypothetical protein PHMEG_0008774 [Phytophthora megakarya]|uniref:Uncharacterized protein n=1 Tax=Phytophthora megakarya TaxID=4795 RepID=A0A225WHV2_9STRA|nr:hypothetical protein PHMEG_0008774 [Phytophthora megakarya]
MPSYTVDADGDVEMSLPQPIFEVIRAPELSSWDHAALIEWLREWERYVEKMRHRCTTTGKSYENVVATVKGCVKRKTPNKMATYVLKKPMADVTDADIMKAVQARCCTLKNEFVPDDFNGIMEDNDLQGLIGADNTTDAGYKSQMKDQCRLLVVNLQPPVVKAQITCLVDLKRRNSKSDDVALFGLILEHAKVQQRFHRLSQDYATKGESKAAKPDRKSQKTGSTDHNVKPDSARSTMPAGQTGGHWLADCPSATDAQREEALRKSRDAQEQRAGAVRSIATRYVSTGRSVRNNGLVEMAYSPNTGADKSVVPQQTVEALRVIQLTLQVTSLPSAVEVVMIDGRTQLCDQEVLLDLDLTTMAGLVSQRSGLGIDIDQQMVQLAGPSLLEGEVDEIPVGDDIPDSVAGRESTIVLAALLDRAVANGLLMEHAGQGRDLLKKFPDV